MADMKGGDQVSFPLNVHNNIRLLRVLLASIAGPGLFT